MKLSDQLSTIRSFQSEAPVPVVALANELGLRVLKTHSFGPDVSGMIKKDRKRGGDSGYAIFVNADHAKVRRRFTIAHEIAHFIWHKDLIGDGIVEDALLRSEYLSNPAEWQANREAANILMPWHLIDEAKSEGIRTIEALADHFEVSRDAMSVRILGVTYAQAG